MSFEPDKIYLHDPHGYFSEETWSGDNTVQWSEDRIDATDYEYIRSKDIPKIESLLDSVRELVAASRNLIKNQKETGSWNLVCDEEIEFEETLQKISVYFS